MILVAALLVSAAVVCGAMLIVGEVRAARQASAAGDRITAVLTLFAPALTAVEADPRALLVWQPIAKAARRLYPEEFGAIDAATGGTFPFTRERIEAGHAQWTADWLAWEQAHDTQFKLKAAEADYELAQQGSAAARARVDAVQREKLELYQRRYADYVRTAKALQALIPS